MYLLKTLTPRMKHYDWIVVLQITSCVRQTRGFFFAG